MIICHSRKFIFFSNPKTGSESLRAALAPWSEEAVVPFRDRTPDRPFYSHMSPGEADRIFAALGWDFAAYTRITCVRDPYARLVSLYRMIREVDGIWQVRRSLGIGVPGFARWVRGTRPDGCGGGGRPHQRWRRYGTWSARAWCADRVDHVIRLEHLERDIAPVVADLGISPGDLPHLNRRGGSGVSAWYDASLSALVADRYADDLHRFGYRPPVLQEAA